MTLKELAAEYRETAAEFGARIQVIKAAGEFNQNSIKRISQLRKIRRELLETARYLETYYRASRRENER